MATKHTKSVFTVLFQEESAPEQSVQQPQVSSEKKKPVKKVVKPVTKKPVKLSLLEFQQMVAAKEAKQVRQQQQQHQQRGGRRGGQRRVVKKVIMKGHVMAKVVSEKTTPEFDLSKAFPCESAGPLRSNDIGEWGKGVESILAAKDLPDPNAGQTLRNLREAARQARIAHLARQTKAETKTAELFEAFAEENNFGFYDEPDMEEEDYMTVEEEDPVEVPQERQQPQVADDWWQDEGKEEDLTVADCWEDVAVDYWNDDF